MRCEAFLWHMIRICGDIKCDNAGQVHVGLLRVFLQGITLKEVQFHAAKQQRQDKQAIKHQQLQRNAAFNTIEHKRSCGQTMDRTSLPGIPSNAL